MQILHKIQFSSIFCGLKGRKAHVFQGSKISSVYTTPLVGGLGRGFLHPSPPPSTHYIQCIYGFPVEVSVEMATYVSTATWPSTRSSAIEVHNAAECDLAVTQSSDRVRFGSPSSSSWSGSWCGRRPAVGLVVQLCLNVVVPTL